MGERKRERYIGKELCIKSNESFNLPRKKNIREMYYMTIGYWRFHHASDYSDNISNNPMRYEKKRHIVKDKPFTWKKTRRSTCIS